MNKSKNRNSVVGAAMLVFGGLAFAGYPIAWLLLSPKSVLRSNDPSFVMGFGAGVGAAVGVTVGVGLIGLAVSGILRRFRRVA